jgi:hypothetical protein
MYKVHTKHFVPTAMGKGDSLLGSKDDSMMQRPKQPIELNRRIPEMLNNLIMECIEVDPSRRPPSMDEVADKLDFIRARLIAQQGLRRSGALPRMEDGMRSASGSAAPPVPPAPPPSPPPAPAEDTQTLDAADDTEDFDPMDPSFGPIGNGQKPS